MQHDLENLRTEEVGKAIVANPTDEIGFGYCICSVGAVATRWASFVDLGLFRDSQAIVAIFVYGWPQCGW